MTKIELEWALQRLEHKMNDVNLISMPTGPVRDAVKIVIPMIEDLRVIMRETIAKLPEEMS